MSVITDCSERERFVVKSAGEAERWRYELVDVLTGEVVCADGGEPEDQLLVRDWKWVAEALNRYEREARAALAERDKEIAALNELVDDYAANEAKVLEGTMRETDHRRVVDGHVLRITELESALAESKAGK